MATFVTLHETTRRPVQSLPAVQRPERLVLTIVYHPQLRRIGERAVMERDVTQLSRLTPDFHTAEGRIVGPLADPFVSRSPVVLLREGDDVLVTSLPNSPIRLDDKPLLGPVQIVASALRRGVTFALASRVVLLLHYHVDAEESVPKYGLVGESAALQRVREAIALTAALPIPVLVRGESGTGKELVARAIHAVSPRAAQPYVSLNMAALNPQTAVAELFGHARGSFTGAVQAREGHFREADGGTIFLDEIGEATPEVQAMLLRVLETGEIQPVGGGTRRVDVRVIAATDTHLEEAVAVGAFRLALLHRLAGVELLVPPLRQRRDDIPRLVVHFLAQELRRAGYGDRFDAIASDASSHFGPALLAHLLRDPWPGNVRQLSNTVRQMVAALLAGRNVDRLPGLSGLTPPVVPVMPGMPVMPVMPAAPTLPDPPAAPAAPAPAPAPPSPRAHGDISNEALLTAMHTHHWNIRATARALGMSRNVLYARIERCPGIRKAIDIPADELSAAYAEHDGDLEGMAESLRVSLRALQLRVRALRLT